MVLELKTCYHFKDGLNVELIYRSNNKYAAEKAMLSTYRRSVSDIAFTGLKKRPGVTYVTFDGCGFH